MINGEIHTKLLRNIKSEEEIEDSTFTAWKSELEKELPLFWESMEEPIERGRKFSHSS